MAGINLVKNLKGLISVRVSLEIVPFNGKLKFDSKNKDLKSNYSNSSGNNSDNSNDQWKYNYKNHNNNDDDKNNNKKFFCNINND